MNNGLRCLAQGGANELWKFDFTLPPPPARGPPPQTFSVSGFTEQGRKFILLLLENGRINEGCRALTKSALGALS